MKDYSHYLDYLQDDLEEGEQRKPRAKGKRMRPEVVEPLAREETGKEGFNPSFSSSFHERDWILTYLSGFYEDQLITDVLRQVKGGKEANVYCCAAHPSTGMGLIAAKVYRPRMFRNLRNDVLYRQGRDILDDGGNRGRREFLAMKKKTGFGQSLRHTSWLMNEFETMSLLYDAGADVPKPVAHNNNAILMSYMGEERWPAPTLNSVRLDKEEAQPLFGRLLHNVDLMLAAGRVHGDLSAHNLLYWEGEVRIIDFPQAVDPLVNPNALDLLARDVQRLCEYFARYGIVSAPAELTAEIWSRHIPT